MEIKRAVSEKRLLRETQNHGRMFCTRKKKNKTPNDQSLHAQSRRRHDSDPALRFARGVVSLEVSTHGRDLFIAHPRHPYFPTTFHDAPAAV